MPQPKTTELKSLPSIWQAFCKRGTARGRTPARQANSVGRCLTNGDVSVKGHYSGLVLDPELPHTDAMYPSHDHVHDPADHDDMVVETRLVNDMKSILSEKQFWEMIEHLYSVGIEKGKITSGKPRKLKKGWKPERNFEKKSNVDNK